MSRIKRVWDALTGPPPESLSKRSGYKGAENSRLTADWVMRSLPVDDEARWNMRKLRDRARDLSRNSAVMTTFSNLLTTNVLGHCGLELESRVQNNNGVMNEKLNDSIEDAWDEWSASASLDGRLSRVEMEWNGLEGTARDGEGLFRIWRVPALNKFGFALEPLDPDLLDERMNIPAGTNRNEVRLGIEVDAYGRRVAYHVWDRPEGSISVASPRTRNRIPARDIIHIYDPKRASQTRGITWYAPVMYDVRMLDGYIEAELVAARTAAAKMGWFVRKRDEDGPLSEDEQGNFQTEANPGEFAFAPDGYELQDWSPNHPNSAFPDFVKAALRRIASGLGVSYNSLANDLEGVNYSSLKSGLSGERENWKRRQSWWRNQFCLRVYPEWMAQAMLMNAIKNVDARDPRKYLNMRFNARGWASPDPLKDMQAAVLGIQNTLTSRTRTLMEEGVEWEDVLEELEAENKAADEKNISLTTGPASSPPAASEDDTATPNEDSPSKPSSNGTAKTKKDLSGSLTSGRRY